MPTIPAGKNTETIIMPQEKISVNVTNCQWLFVFEFQIVVIGVFEKFCLRLF